MFKFVVLCASAFLVQSIAGQACSKVIPVPCGVVTNNGGSFIVTSVGPIAPTGIAAAADLGLCGDLSVTGTLPFLSAVEFGTSLPTNGIAAVSYGCGDGNIAITQETGNPYGNSASSSGLTVGSLGCGCRPHW